MALHLFDSASNQIRLFQPLQPGQVGIYLCGATVQAEPHIGHLRPAVAFDILRRWLQRNGLNVTLIRNVTDIDDKILAKAAEHNVPWWAWALMHERLFTAAYQALGILPPTYEPRATGHVTDMIELMSRLVERGHAYCTSPGNVYFDTGSWPEYGTLTHQKPQDLTSTEDDGQKRSPHDFALWKAAKAHEPSTASWPTPWGRGRPGWHLECSAMAWRYLGDEFDIHGGGLDLRFPHHENEIAQSRAAGLGFARYWLHNAWVTQAGAKMSKSVGNVLSAASLLNQAPPAVLRYALTAGHYRSMIEWTSPSQATTSAITSSNSQTEENDDADTLAVAQAAWDRLSGFVERSSGRFGRTPTAELNHTPLPPAFVEAMDDDLSTPSALAVIHETVRRGNTALAEYDDQVASQALTQARAMLAVLGLDPLDPHWCSQSANDNATQTALAALIEAQLTERAAARTARDFATADTIRDNLAAAGVIIEDSPEGSRWSLN